MPIIMGNSKICAHQKILIYLIGTYIFSIGILGDYFKYKEKVFNEISFLSDSFLYIFYFLKILIVIYTLFYTVLYKKLLKIDFLIFFMISIYIISSAISYFIDGNVILFGKYFLVGSLNSSEVAGFEIKYFMITFLDYLVLAYFGLIIKNKEQMIKVISIAVLLTLPFNILNALLQFRSFFGNWGEGAIFFLTEINGSIPMRLTGLFASTFMFAAYLSLIQVLLLTQNIVNNKFKNILLIAILLLHIMSLNRSGIIIFLLLMAVNLNWRSSFYRPHKLIIYMSILIGFFTIILIYTQQYIDLDFFSRLTQAVDTKENYSLAFRIEAPITNIATLFSDNLVFTFFGLGNNQGLVSDNNLVVFFYKYGWINLLLYIVIVSKAFLSKINVNNISFFMFWLMTNLLFSGAGQFVNFILILFISLQLYNDRKTAS